MLFIETSAKTAVGIQQVFQEVILKILEQPTLLESAVRTGNKQRQVKLDDKSAGTESGGGGLCC